MGRPTKAQAEAWTQDLLDTARALFCEKGYAGTSLDELAVRLRCSKHSIYRRFTDKEALFGAVVDRDVARFVAALEAARCADPCPSMALRAMARAYFGFGASRDYAALYAVMNLEAATSPRLRLRAGHWAKIALAPMRSGIAAIASEADAGGLCEVLVDLLDGAANRVRLGEGTAAETEAAFTARWGMFLRLLAT